MKTINNSKAWTSARVKADFAQAFPVEKPVAAKQSKLKYIVASVVLAVSVTATTVVAVNNHTPQYVGTEEVYIEWGTEVATIEDAIVEVNPTATEEHVEDAVKEFIHMNHVNNSTIKAGTYAVPVMQ